jgi:general secretion pathway protein N
MTRAQQLSFVLMGFISIAVVTFVALKLGMGAGYQLAPADQSPTNTQMGPLVVETNKIRPWSEYSEVLARPLFNESRAPELEKTEAPGDNAPAALPALNVNLTGIILTKELRIAIVTDPAKGVTQRVKQGQPLEGELAGWTLIELKPRMAVFEGAGAERQELELTTDSKPGAIVPPMPGFASGMPNLPTPYPQPGQNMPSMHTQPLGAPPAFPDPSGGLPVNSEEIRRRIEERRRQLREEAEQMQQQNQNNNQAQ